MKILLNFIGFFLMIFIIFWFWLSKKKSIRPKENKIRILVKGGVYSPSRIEISSEKEITLEFLRQDSSACSESVLFNALDVQKTLPLNKPVQINLGHLKPGTYLFSCPMKMYLGELIVVK